MLADDSLMTAGEVAQVFGVDTRTVGRWSREGRLSWIATPGGRRRYRRSDVEALKAATEHPRRPS